MKRYEFGIGKWSKDDFLYVYSPASKSYKEFLQEDICIANSFNEEINDFDYISMVTKKRYTSGIKVSAKCSFEKFGAPLIVLTDEINGNPQGKSIYGTHFEIVPYEKGCNVWKVFVPEKGSNMTKSIALLKMEFQIEAGSIIDLEVKIKEESFLIKVNDKVFEVENKDIPESFHVGITACEGVNRFYEFVIND